MQFGNLVVACQYCSRQEKQEYYRTFQNTLGLSLADFPRGGICNILRSSQQDGFGGGSRKLQASEGTDTGDVQSNSSNRRSGLQPERTGLGSKRDEGCNAR